MVTYLIGELIETEYGDLLVTKGTIDSIEAYLKKHNITLNSENIEDVLANLELSPGEAESFMNGEEFEVQINDSEEDMLSDMRTAEDFLNIIKSKFKIK